MVMEIHKVSAVLHLAGKTPLNISKQQPIRFYEGNTAASIQLIESAIACGVPHFIYSSTAECYGPTSGPISDGSACHPASAYAASCYAVEQILTDVIAAYPMNFGVLRYFNAAAIDLSQPSGVVHAANAGKAGTHPLHQAIEVVVGRRDHVQIPDHRFPTPDGSAIRDYVHVSDVASAHVAMLEALLSNSNSNLICNCGYGRGWSDFEVLDAVERLTNVRVVRRRTGAAEIPPEQVVDATLLHDVLGWRPVRDNLDMMIRDTFTWLMRNNRFRSSMHDLGATAIRRELPSRLAVLRELAPTGSSAELQLIKSSPASPEAVVKRPAKKTIASRKPIQST